MYILRKKVVCVDCWLCKTDPLCFLHLAPSTQHIAKVLTEAESSPSPKTKKKGGFWRRNTKGKDDTPTITESTPPASPNPFSLAQEVAKKAKSLPRDGLKHLEKQPFQASFEASDVDSGVYDHHDSGRDSVEPPELPTRGYLSDEAEDDAPELPPREYHWSDLDSDGDDDEDDDDAGGNEEILQKVYDSLAKFGGPSKETEKLYDTLEQYQKTLMARKQTTQQPEGGTSTYTHYHTHTYVQRKSSSRGEERGGEDGRAVEGRGGEGRGEERRGEKRREGREERR